MDVENSLSFQQGEERYVSAVSREGSPTMKRITIAVAAVVSVGLVMFMSQGPSALSQQSTPSTVKVAIPSLPGSALNMDEEGQTDSQLVLKSALDARGLDFFSMKEESDKLELFSSFKDIHGKSYDTEDEESKRYGIFLTNLEIIDKLNAASDTVEYGITPLSDLTPDEFKSRNNLYLDDFSLAVSEGREDGESEEAIKRGFVSYKKTKDKDRTGKKQKNDDNADNFDWREQGVVTPVRNQGVCGDCWAFAATEDIEGSVAIASGGKAIRLSEQQVGSCDTEMAGCNGGIMSSAYEYVIKAGGITTEDEYPYEAAEGVMPECRADFSLEAAIDGADDSGDSSGAQRFKITSWTQIQAEDDEELREQLRANGPMAFAINANQMQFYQKGIDEAGMCLEDQPNHAVLLVGYGQDKASGLDYWLIKNTWGTEWGEDGYYRISTENGACGIHTCIQHSVV